MTSSLLPTATSTPNMESHLAQELNHGNTIDRHDDDDESGDPYELLNTIDNSNDFKQLHQLRGYSQPSYSSGFSEALRLLEW